MSVGGGLSIGTGLGAVGLGAAQVAQSFALPTMSKSALSYIAHLYDRKLVFKRTLGGAAILSKPSLKQTQNGGFQPIVLKLAAPAPIKNLAADITAYGIYNNGPEAATIATIADATAQSPPDFRRIGWLVPNTSQKGVIGGTTLWAPGETYTVSFYARGTGGAVGVAMALFWNTPPAIQTAVSNPALTGAWQQYIFRLTWGTAVEAAGNIFCSIDSACAAGTLDLDSLQIEVGSSATTAGIMLGDVIRLTEQGDSTGSYLLSGTIETTPEEDVPGAAAVHTLEITPWLAELSDADFDHVYAATDPSGGLRSFTAGPVDVAQFVRDAVSLTAHLSVSPISCPNTGIKVLYDFQGSNGLDAVHVAKQIAGANYWYFVDAQGLVWFQPVYTDANHPATITLRRGADFNYKLGRKTVKGMRNRFRIYGGSNAGDPGRISATYGVSSDPRGNQALYGVRAYNPSLAYPTVTDQTTLNAIAASLGAQFDRVLVTRQVRCPALGIRLSPARVGGMTVRLFEPPKESQSEPGAEGSGVYDQTLILQDVEAIGPKQILFIGDIPYTDIDPAYEATRIAQRMSVIGATALPTPPLVPQPPPVSTVTNGAVNASTGIFAMGGGIVTIATATFTTTRAGTCQVVGAIDARMEAWDNYIAVPRRSVRATLSGGIFTGAWQELPFGLTRATYDLSSASGIALPAGTYTVVIQIDTQEFNQMHVYSGYVQVAVTS